MKYHVLFSSLLLAALVTADTASAQPPCGKRDDIIKMLSDKYREEPRVMGLDSKSTLLEIFASKAGTWTMLVTKPNGSSCVVGAGDSWEEMPPAKVSQLSSF